MTQSPSRRLADVFWRLCKWCGFFQLARYVTRRRVRILCYHGFGTSEEVDFRPGLFITPATFERRLRYLAAYKYPVVGLAAALDAFDRGIYPDATTVITVDDVFFGFYRHAWPPLRRHGYPVTAYLTTYYCERGGPIFRLAVRYIMWKTTASVLNMSEIDDRMSGQFDLTSPAGRDDAESSIIAFGEALPTERERTELARQLACRLAVDLEPLVISRTVDIVSVDEARELARNGVDFQLHTHRHRLPEDPERLTREVQDNRAVLRTIGHGPFDHLCYPSGIWSPTQWDTLARLGVVSATTCDPGLNTRDTPRLALKRILDSEDVSQISFEAEMCGLKSLIRSLRAKVQGPSSPQVLCA
jgi:peptidoglycan/xylan/chitin deacetylase (PgdA/CDA1 family)